MPQIELLFASPLLQVRDHRCTAARGPAGPRRGGDRTQLRLVRRGCFRCHLGSRSLLADASVACLQFEDAEYRASHPCDGGDDCTLIEAQPQLRAEVFGDLGPDAAAFPMQPAVQLAHAAVYAALRAAGSDRLATEELVLDLLRRVVGGPPLPSDRNRAGQRRIVADARAVLNRRLDVVLGLDEVAGEVGVSPFHLMHLFRAHAGMALRAYRNRLRVAAALSRLAEGADDLTGLALDLGFASHSHMTRVFNQVLGAPPSVVRTRLTRAGLSEARARAAA